ncbi:MAG: exodeoxyribonuclease VII small subunit [Chloroflexi bacterium]|jgi:exodeoxyribonuclease VII small subunit|nr:exodeoxyribonuclease VII small subunit [Chloroflexota bacterium]
MSGADALRATGASTPAPSTEPGDAAVEPVETLAFDDALAELQRTVAALEEGGLPLERTLELYERGAALHARCATLLDEAEIRIRRLVDGPGGAPTVVDEASDAAGWEGPHEAATEEARR